MKIFSRILITILLIIILYFSLGYLGIFGIKFWGVKRENARREVFEQSQSYVEAKRQSIVKYYDEYRNADSNEKIVIRKIVLQEFANFDLNKLSPQQLQWYNQITQ